jgi:PAS domain S-box-containing protein
MTQPTDGDRHSKAPQWIPTRATAIKIAGIYALASLAWVCGSDAIVHHLPISQKQIDFLENAKGSLFVMVTAGLLGAMLIRYFRRIEGTVGTLQATQAELKRSEEWLHLSLEGAQAGTWEWELATNKNIWSEELWRLYGLPRNSRPPSFDTWLESVHPADRERASRTVVAAAENSASLSVEWRTHNHPQGERWLLSSGRPFLDAAGKPVRYVGIVMDITARKQAELALREREQQLQLLVEFSPAAIAMLDREMRYLITSQRWLRDYHLQNQQVIGRTHYEVFPETPQRWREIHSRCLAGEIAANDGEAFPRADGSVDWVRWEIRPWRTADGEVGGILLFSELITERKKAEEKLKRQSALIKSLLDSIPDLIFYKDLNGVYLGCNPAFAEFTGRSRERIVGATDSDLFEPRVAEEFRAHDQQMLKLMNPRQDEEWVSYPDGRRVLLDTLKLPYQGPDGTLIGVLGISRDITARRKAEEALRVSEEKFSIAFARNPAAIAITRLEDGLFYEVNETWLSLLGYKREEVIGKTSQELGINREPEKRVQAIGEIHKQRFLRDYEQTLHTQSGQALTVLTNINLLTIAGEDYALSSFQDITLRKQLEAQLRQVQKLEGIGQLAGGIAHDFNNILGALLMQLGLVQTAPNLAEEVSRSLIEMEREIRRATTLTQQMLMFSRRSVLAVKPLNLAEVCQNMLKMLGRLIGEQNELQFVRAGDLPLIEADAGMMEQILMNLVVNARDAMPRGGRITVEVSHTVFPGASTPATGERRPGAFVCLSVSDTGCGMDSATIKRIFEPFFTTKEVGKGTGLGLATVHGIVAQHKGWIEVESQPGRGSLFRVFFPATLVLPKEACLPPAAKPARRGHEAILLVEDEVRLRQCIARILRSLGYEVHEARTGQEAIDLWQRLGNKIDLLLTDMLMPEGITGLELSERLRAMNPKLKVIISSGYSAEIAQAGVPTRAGILYLPKPYPTEALADAVRKCLEPAGPAPRGA